MVKRYYKQFGKPFISLYFEYPEIVVKCLEIKWNNFFYILVPLYGGYKCDNIELFYRYMYLCMRDINEGKSFISTRHREESR